MKRKIVIEIEEGIIASLNDENQWSALLLAELKDAFANGTPLPKGHGRLIDENDLVYEDLECTDGNTYMIVHAPYVDNAPTIIDKDGE